VLTPLVSEALLKRLQETFPADIVGMASYPSERIHQTIGEQRVLQVLQAWHNAQDPFQEVR
jgi:Ni,Fe-hydrogenase III component G